MSNTTSPAPNWFTQFHGFVYEPSAGLQSNFLRLASVRKWGGRLKDERWAECQSTQFNNLYGTDTAKLETWQSLCREVYVKNPPGSITRCKKVSNRRSVLLGKSY
jgi:hypothetical protein